MMARTVDDGSAVRALRDLMGGCNKGGGYDGQGEDEMLPSMSPCVGIRRLLPP